MDLTGGQTALSGIQKAEPNILKAEEASDALRILPVEVVPDPEGPGALVFGVPPGRAFQRHRALRKRDSPQVLHTCPFERNGAEEARDSPILTEAS